MGAIRQAGRIKLVDVSLIVKRNRDSSLILARTSCAISGTISAAQNSRGKRMFQVSDRSLIFSFFFQRRCELFSGIGCVTSTLWPCVVCPDSQVYVCVHECVRASSCEDCVFGRTRLANVCGCFCESSICIAHMADEESPLSTGSMKGHFSLCI